MVAVYDAIGWKAGGLEKSPIDVDFGACFKENADKIRWPMR